MYEQRFGRVSWTFDVTGDRAEQPVRQTYMTKPIFPREAEVTWHPERIDGSGPMRWNVKVTGPQVKKDGTPSLTDAEHSWGHYDRAEAPDVVRELVEATRERAAQALSVQPVTVPEEAK